MQLKLFDDEPVVPEPEQDTAGNFKLRPGGLQASTSKRMRLTAYAVLQLGDRPCVWGIGRQRLTAIDDALRWCIDHGSMGIQNAVDMDEAIQAGELIVCRCSRKFFKEIEEYGGDMEFNGIKFKFLPAIGVFLQDEFL